MAAKKKPRTDAARPVKRGPNFKVATRGDAERLADLLLGRDPSLPLVPSCHAEAAAMKAIQLTKSKSPKVALNAVKIVLAYAYGLPKQRTDIRISDNRTLIYARLDAVQLASQSMQAAQVLSAPPPRDGESDG